MKKIIIALALFCSLVLPATASAISELDRLNGRFLIQDLGGGKSSLWYVNPLEKQRYYVADNTQAIKLVETFSIWINGKTYDLWKDKAPRSYKGKILIVYDRHGEAYYVNTESLKLTYLGTKAQMYQKMKSQAVTVKSSSLAEIPVKTTIQKPTAQKPTTITKATSNKLTFNWRYRSKDYSLSLGADSAWYNKYQNSQKYYQYSGDLPKNWRDSYYNMFLKPTSGDTLVKDLATNLKSLAKTNNLTDDQLIELSASFVQSIPYDTPKASQKDAKPNYPYETLYTKLGICTDKAFLMVAILRELGFGSAVLDFEKANHAAAGVQCPQGQDYAHTGYCYIETTNYFPVGVLPKNFGTNGIVSDKTFSDIKGQFDNAFTSSALTDVEVVAKTTGREYQGIILTKNRVARLQSLEKTLADEVKSIEASKKTVASKKSELSDFTSRMNTLQANKQTDEYNRLVPEYNQVVAAYNQALSNYNYQVKLYNSNVADYNYLVNDFYSAK